MQLTFFVVSLAPITSFEQKVMALHLIGTLLLLLMPVSQS